MNLYNPKQIKYIREKYGFRFSKNLGQNFLTDKSVIDKIIDGSQISGEDTVIEIGPGIGVLTCEAAKKAKNVIAVEIDRDLLQVLKETLGDFNNIQVINEDILKIRINDLVAGQKAENVKILGNLPYYITTPIIMKLLKEGAKASVIMVMMQKEVADRLRAQPATKAYGAVSVAVQYYCVVEKVTDVPRSAFVPQPKVDSEVLRLMPLAEKPVNPDNEKVFFECIKAGFGQRRKTLLNSLQTVAGANKEIIGESIKAAGIEPTRRAETLTLEEFAALSNEVNKRL